MLKSNIKKKGFTLVELLVVMAILGILIAVAIAGIAIVQRASRDNVRQRDLTSIKGVLEDYYGSIRTRQYPDDSIVNLNTSTNQFQIGTTGSLITLQQPGAHLVKGLTCDTAGTGLTQADTSNWYIGYAKVSSGASYKLCTKLENGNVYDLSL
jgi:prepilin-type N-terminal cleavage/methylation domain-containing protein